MAPPSTVGGKPYVVVKHGPLTAAPSFDAIRAFLEPAPERPAFVPREGQARTAHLAGWVARLQEGNRNAGPFWALCRAFEAGDDAAVQAIADAAAAAGLGAREIAASVRSAQRAACPKADREATS